MEEPMKLNEHPGNRAELEKSLESRRAELLGRIGPRTEGLLVWHFGAGGEGRDVREIPTARVERFVRFYAAA
jgi:hypothetical protein